MSFNSPDPVFDPTSFPRGDGLSENETSGGRGPRPGSVGAASSEIGAIAAAIEELQSRLAQAHKEVAQGAAEQVTESEIGRMCADEPRGSEAFLSKLETQIQEILVEAEAKAAEILREANEEAAEIVRRAQPASFIRDRATDELQTAIVGFADVNTELVKKLAALNDMLTPTTGPRSDSVSHATDDRRAG